MAITISALYRYPVKSMQGEALPSTEVVGRGVPGDRAWGVRDLSSGLVLSAKRWPMLLRATARQAGDEVSIELPSGEVVRSDEPEMDPQLCALVGRPVRLERATDERATYEIGTDPADDDSPTFTFDGPPGSFHDSGHGLHFITVVSLDAIGSDVRRFRPNVVLAGAAHRYAEDGWVGQSLSVGTAVFEVRKRTVRCVLITRPQSGLERDLGLLQGLARDHGSEFGVYSAVLTPGVIAVGDEVRGPSAF